MQLAVGIKTSDSDVQGFRQTLKFNLRVMKAQGTPLPFRPNFFLFEDPEHNRRLTSTPAQKTAVVSISEQFLGDPAPKAPMINLTLAADRNEYNPTGAIHYLFYFDPPKKVFGEPDGSGGFVTIPITGKVAFSKVSAQGTTTPLRTVSKLPVKLPVNSLPASAADQDLQSICSNESLIPGDTLVLSLTLDPPGDKVPPVVLSIPIVAKSVIPVPSAGYALLRKYQDPTTPISPVECVRFAFSPAPTRIELVDPNDLHQQLVRRRAVFQWQDTVRIGRAYTYAIQKIATGGSTHFPALPPAASGIQAALAMTATSSVAHTEVNVTDGAPTLNGPFVGKTVSMKAEVNGRYVSAAQEGKNPLIADPTKARQWELFDVVAAGAGHVALWARANGKYVTAKDGLSPLIAGADTAAAPGVLFDIKALDASRFALRSVGNGKYVRADKDGRSPLIADRDTAGLSEWFSLEIVRLTVNGQFVGKRVSMKAEVNGKYVCAADEGKSPLIADRTEAKQWELFDVVAAGGGHVALRACANGKCVTAKDGLSPLIADTDAAAGPGVLFDIEALDTDAGRYALRAVGHGKYVCADKGGQSPLIANRDTTGLWERFRLEIA